MTQQDPALADGQPPGADGPAGDDRRDRAEAAGPIIVNDRRFWARPDGDDDGQARPSKPSYVRDLEAELAAAKARSEAVLAQYRQARDEFEAARARLRREVTREAEAGRRALLGDLLEVVDNLDRAIEHEGTGDAATLRDGVRLVREQFLGKLGQLGVRPMQPLGQAFDARCHEALATVPPEGRAAGEVAAVIRSGYMLNEEVLRAAQVAVARGAADPQEDV